MLILVILLLIIILTKYFLTFYIQYQVLVKFNVFLNLFF
jgi:hypothetical protein